MVIGEMGTCKTYISIAAAKQSGQARILVVCPSHLVHKWQREVYNTLPKVKAVIVSNIQELKHSFRWDATPERPVFTIISKEYAKLGYSWKPAVIWQKRHQRPLRDPETDELVIEPHCPACHHIPRDKDDVPLDYQQLNSKQLSCPSQDCGQPLWQATRSANTIKPRIALADYIKKFYRHRYDLLIVDEVQDYKSKDSGQGISVGIMAECARRTIALTGTLMGGYSSTIFHILYRFSKEIRDRYQYHEHRRWIRDYGFEEQLHRVKDDDVAAHGRSSRRRLVKEQPREKPGISPKALYHLIGNTVFIRLEDVDANLPSYQEHVVAMPLSRQIQQLSNHPPASQATAYEGLYRPLKAAMSQQAALGSKRLMGKYIQSLLSYPDACVRPEAVTDGKTGEIIAAAPALSAAEVYPKEKALLDIVAQEKALGRRVLVYISHTDTRDISPRLQSLLTAAGCRSAVLKSGAPASQFRERWVESKVREGIDALIVNPQLVQTGLDLVQFPTIVWFETNYSVYVTRQASRRSWRVGQTQPVKVYFLTYEDTMQLQAINLIARKTQASLALEGDLPEEGLAVFNAADEDIIVSLARQMLQEAEDPNNPAATAASLEAILRNSQEQQAQANELIAAAGWHVVPPLPPRPPSPFAFNGAHQDVSAEDRWNLEFLKAMTPTEFHNQDDARQSSLFDFALAASPTP